MSINSLSFVRSGLVGFKLFQCLDKKLLKAPSSENCNNVTYCVSSILWKAIKNMFLLKKNWINKVFLNERPRIQLKTAGLQFYILNYITNLNLFVIVK